MASGIDTETNAGNLRWYCHACEVETETVTEVTNSGYAKGHR